MVSVHRRVCEEQTSEVRGETVGTVVDSSVQMAIVLDRFDDRRILAERRGRPAGARRLACCRTQAQGRLQQRSVSLGPALRSFALLFVLCCPSMSTPTGEWHSPSAGPFPVKLAKRSDKRRRNPCVCLGRWDASLRRRHLADGDVVLLFDLNGTLTSHTAQRRSSGRNRLRPGTEDLMKLKVRDLLPLLACTSHQRRFPPGTFSAWDIQLVDAPHRGYSLVHVPSAPR